jgi:hypothetical protein
VQRWAAAARMRSNSPGAGIPKGEP